MSRTLAIYVILVSLITGFIIGYHTRPRPKSVETVVTNVVTDTVYTKPDTVTVTKPVPYRTEIVKRDTFQIYYANELIVETDQNWYREEIATPNNDTVTVNAVTTGTLDSLWIELKRMEIIKTIYKTEKVKDRGLKVTPQLGVGYGIFSRKPDLYAGVGISYNF